MKLLLEIINTPSHSVFEKTMSFNQMGGKIGRNKYMDWVLHDPTKKISNFHAEIMFKNNQYFIMDKSSNGTFLKDPYKQLTKDTPVPLTQITTIIIGEYEINVKIVNNTFINDNSPSSKQNNTEDFAIPDQFFMGNDTKKAFDVINQKEDDNDILSLINNDMAYTNSNPLPELDSIMGDNIEGNTDNINHSLNVHIEDHTMIPIQEKEGQKNTYTDDKLLNLLGMKLGVDVEKMNKTEQEDFILEVSELLNVSIEQSQVMLTSLNSIKNQLGITRESQLVSLGRGTTTKDFFTHFHLHNESSSKYMKNIFHQINTHNVALFTANNNISLDTLKKFSPQKLYFSFEQENLLDKKLANKKSLAWDAYYNKFKYLDILKNKEDLDMTELAKEYQNIIETLNLGH